MAARLIQGADIEIFPTRQLLELATTMALQLDHPAYDCVYLALAVDNDWRFVNADERLRRTLGGRNVAADFRHAFASLSEAAGRL